MKKLLLPIFLSSLIRIPYANYLDDWTNEDLCRWMDAALIPEHISEEIYTRQLSCYASFYSGKLTAQIPYYNENSNANQNFSGFDIPGKDGRNGHQLLTNSVFNGIDMSGYTPPLVGSMDSRIYYINGHQQIGGTTHINSLKSYLESIGRGDVFSESPPAIKPPIPIKFNFKITF
jgi:hypothetical protein